MVRWPADDRHGGGEPDRVLTDRRGTGEVHDQALVPREEVDVPSGVHRRPVLDEREGLVLEEDDAERAGNRDVRARRTLLRDAQELRVAERMERDVAGGRNDRAIVDVGAGKGGGEDAVEVTAAGGG